MIDEGQAQSIVDQSQEQSKRLQRHQYKKVSHYAYSTEWKLGAGSFSKVYKGVDTRNNMVVAVKVITLQTITSKIAVTLLEQEISIIKQLDHENVIKCFDVLNSSNNCYIITQYCKYGDLDKLLKVKNKFLENQISPYVYHIFKGLKYLAEKGIIHRDFKIANIFVNESNICKIADFGFAFQSREQFKDICLGSPIYMAPQAILSKQYGPKTDIWAFGVLIYELICGMAPLAGVKSQQQIKQRIILPPPTIKQHISPQLRNFIDRCLTISVKNRISISQIQNHEYIRKITIQNQAMKMSGSLQISSQKQTSHTSKSSRLIYKAIQNPLSYQEARSLFQYCRLLSKVCQCVKSPVLEQWLLRMINDLNKTNIKQNQGVDYKEYKQTISSYCTRYHKQFKDRGVKVRIDDALKECQQLLAKDKKHKMQIMAIGTQTNLLRQALFHPLKLLYYAKNSKVEVYLGGKK